MPGPERVSINPIIEKVNANTRPSWMQRWHGRFLSHCGRMHQRRVCNDERVLTRTLRLEVWQLRQDWVVRFRRLWRRKLSMRGMGGGMCEDSTHLLRWSTSKPARSKSMISPLNCKG